jgi:hypothetical protein
MALIPNYNPDLNPPALGIWQELECKEPVPISDFMGVRSLCKLFGTVHADPKSGLSAPDGKSNAANAAAAGSAEALKDANRLSER